MFPPAFDYRDPATVEEVVALLGQHGGEARLLAGGQTLVAAMNLGLVQPGLVVDLNRVAGLDAVAHADGTLRLGAMVRHRTLAASSDLRTACPLLAEAAGLIGNARVRNRGTLGGSLAQADPAAELPAALLALDAELRLLGPGGERGLPAGEFFVGTLSTALGEMELLTEVRLPAWPARTGWAFEEVARRPGDYAIVGAAARLTLAADGTCADLRLSFAGAADRPVRAPAAELALRGAQLTPARLIETAALAADQLEIQADAFCSVAYRRHLARVLANRALTRAAERAAA
jgi:carbon-monoxide dehydrogenase medium subunit